MIDVDDEPETVETPTLSDAELFGEWQLRQMRTVQRVVVDLFNPRERSDDDGDDE